MSALPSWMDEALEVSREQVPAGATYTQELLRFEHELALETHAYYDMFLEAVTR